MGLESVGDLAIHVILKKLSPEDVGRVACVNKRLRSSASDDPIWIKFCSHDLSLTQPTDPLGNPLPSFKVRPSSLFPLFHFAHFPFNFNFQFSIFR